MRTNVKKTNVEKKIKSFEFYKMQDHRRYRMTISGFLFLENGDRIQVKSGKYLFLNDLGEISGIVLKTNPIYKKIKRLIARWFSTYRKGRKSMFIDSITYWKSRVIDGIHNVNLFKYSEIKFSENRSNFLKLAS